MKKNTMRLCFSIPASPTEGFFSQIAIFRLALNKLGGNYQDADIILSLGDKIITEIPKRWIHAFGSGVLIRWADPDYYKEVGWNAQGENRWKQNYNDYEVLICDGGSKDGSLEVINKYCKVLPNIIAIPKTTTQNFLNVPATIAMAKPVRI